MAGKSKSGKRIEPSFEGGKRSRDEDLRADPRDRVGKSKATRSTKSAPARSSRSTSSRSRRSGGFFSFLRRTIYWMLVLCLWGALGVAGLVVYLSSVRASATNGAALRADGGVLTAML